MVPPPTLFIVFSNSTTITLGVNLPPVVGTVVGACISTALLYNAVLPMLSNPKTYELIRHD